MLNWLARRGAAVSRAVPRYEPGQPVCFMHVPKASGTSLAAGLQTALASDAPVRGFDHVLFGGFTGFAAFSEAERGAIYGPDRDLPAGVGFIAGHFAYSTLRRAYPDGQLVTFLREPVSRLLSHWMFWRKAEDSELADLGGWGDYVRLARGSLHDFLTAPMVAAQTDNLALRMLVWPHDLVPVDGFIDPAHDGVLLRLALARLAEFSLAGIVEAPDLAERIGGWLGRGFDYAHRNATDTMPPALRTPLAGQLDAPALARLDACSRLDLALWTHLAEPYGGAGQIRMLTILRHVARYGALMAS